MAFIAVVAVVVLWANGLATRKAEDKRRAEEIASANASRAELLKTLKESIDSNNDLTKQCIRAIEKQTSATDAMNRTIQYHYKDLAEKIDHAHNER